MGFGSEEGCGPCSFVSLSVIVFWNLRSFLISLNQKYTSKYVYKYDYAGKGYYSNQFDFSDPGQGSTKFGSGNNSYYEVGVPIDDGSVYFDDRDLPPDDREPRFESKVQESIWRLKNNK